MDSIDPWDGQIFLDAVVSKTGLKKGQVYPILRAKLTGTLTSPDLADVITILGSDEVWKRLKGI